MITCLRLCSSCSAGGGNMFKSKSPIGQCQCSSGPTSLHVVTAASNVIIRRLQSWNMSCMLRQNSTCLVLRYEGETLLNVRKILKFNVSDSESLSCTCFVLIT